MPCLVGGRVEGSSRQELVESRQVTVTDLLLPCQPRATKQYVHQSVESSRQPLVTVTMGERELWASVSTKGRESCLPPPSRAPVDSQGAMKRA